jgi:hypothetical protein
MSVVRVSETFGIESYGSLVIQWGGLIRRGSPMWTAKNRGRYDRGKLRYPSDLTDSEWSWLNRSFGKRGGGKRTVVMREVVNGSFAMPIPGTETSSLPSI